VSWNCSFFDHLGQQMIDRRLALTRPVMTVLKIAGQPITGLDGLTLTQHDVHFQIEQRHAGAARRWRLSLCDCFYWHHARRSASRCDAWMQAHASISKG
jgi:hypothetical protein